MKTTIVNFVFLLLLLFCNLCGAKGRVKVLFVGNSLTYYHDMPKTVQKMIDEQHMEISVQQMAFPGSSLAAHLSQTTVKGNQPSTALKKGELSATSKKILNEKWDYVILQEGTIGYVIPETRKYAVETAVAKLDSMIKLSGGKTILYQAFVQGTKYPVRYCHQGLVIKAQVADFSLPLDTRKQYCSDSFLSHGYEFNAVKVACNEIATEINAQLARVGDAFELANKEFPEIGLCDGDEIHPSKEGAYLIACVFYKTITGKSPVTLKYNGALKNNTAAKLRKIADAVK